MTSRYDTVEDVHLKPLPHASHGGTCQVLVEDQMSLLGLREIMLVNVKLESATKLVLLTRGRAIGERANGLLLLGTEGGGNCGLILLPPRQSVDCKVAR